MQKVVIDKPYEFVPPYPGKFWVKLLNYILTTYLKKTEGIVQFEFRGEQYLRSSIAAGYGIILAPNHSRPADPIVMGMLSRRLKQPFFYMASWHLFMQSEFQAWVLRRFGAFSVYREGVDRHSVRAATDILVGGVRPLVLFPEGLVSRTNDMLRPFMEGVSLMAVTAAKQRVKLAIPGKIVAHPVAIKYKLLTDVELSLNDVLDEIESRLTWQHREVSIFDRVMKVGEALLSLKELEFVGTVQSGTIAGRVQSLIDHLLVSLEKKWLNGKKHDTFMGRVKALRAVILEGMLKGELEPDDQAARWQNLADIYLAVQLSNYPENYLGENPSQDRLSETIEKYEEDLTDKVRVHGPRKVIIQVGEPLEVRAERGRGEERLTVWLQERVQSMLEALAKEVGT